MTKTPSRDKLMRQLNKAQMQKYDLLARRRLKIDQIEPEGITVLDRLRALNQSKVNELAASMDAIGQQQPITVWLDDPDDADQTVYLVAGAHRLAAAKKLGWDEINIIFAYGMTEIDRQLWEIDENLMRAELSPTERGEHITRRAEIWDAMPEMGGLCARPQIEARKVKPVERKSVSRDWLRKFMAEASPHLAGLMCFMAFTGIRVGKACALTWYDIDLARGYATVGIDKNGKPHRVALGATVIAALANIPGPKAGKVFRYAARRSVYGVIRRTCERAGIEYLATHQPGRHTFATWFLEEGHNLEALRQAGNWSSARLIMERYAHLEKSDIDEKVRGLRGLGENRGTDQPYHVETATMKGA